MKRVFAALLVGCAILVASGCGSDNTTNFVLSSGSASASTSPGSSPSADTSASASASPGSSSGSTTVATPIPSGRRIIIDSPDGSTPIASPVQVSGTASVTNGQVLVVVRDAAGKELGRATATASASKPDYGHFDVSVTFSGGAAGAKGEIRAMDAATQKNYYFVTIRFG